jgi:hypothetical protein
MSLTKVSFSMINGASVNVLDYGAVGDGVADDSAAIQAAINFGNTNQVAVYFPAKTYKLSSTITLPGQVYLYGDGGFNKSVLVGYSASIFNYATLDGCVFEKLSFKAVGTACTAFKQTNLSTFTSNCVWRTCDFFTSLTECLYGNFILCTIDSNNFGYHGPTTAGQTSHRHIYCKGDPASGNTANINRISRNKFYNAYGGAINESCYFESGYLLTIQGNTYETNNTRALTLAGMSSIDIQNNWFENNDNANCIYLSNNAGATIGDYVVHVENNWFTTNTAGSYIFSVNGSSEISSFSYNNGAGSFVGVCSDNSKIIHAESNFFTGVISLPPVKITNLGEFVFGGPVYVAGTNAIQLKTATGFRNFSSASTASVNQIIFENPNGAVGSIQTSGSGTTYGTTSDQDLKNDLGVAITTDVIENTIIHDFTWKASGEVDRGVFAQEAFAVKPTAVIVGADELNEKGQKMQPWGVDYSKYVPDLIVYVKKLKADFEEYKANHP